MSDEGKLHTIRQGDSATSLAFQHGLFWETLWNHDQNSDLREQRSDHNVLLAGDEIFMPDRSIKQEGRTSGAHTLRRMGVPERLNFQFLDIYSSDTTTYYDGKKYVRRDDAVDVVEEDAPAYAIVDDRPIQGLQLTEVWERRRSRKHEYDNVQLLGDRADSCSPSRSSQVDLVSNTRHSYGTHFGATPGHARSHTYV